MQTLVNSNSRKTFPHKTCATRESFQSLSLRLPPTVVYVSKDAYVPDIGGASLKRLQPSLRRLHPAFFRETLAPRRSLKGNTCVCVVKVLQYFPLNSRVRYAQLEAVSVVSPKRCENLFWLCSSSIRMTQCLSDLSGADIEVSGWCATSGCSLCAHGEEARRRLARLCSGCRLPPVAGERVQTALVADVCGVDAA